MAQADSKTRIIVNAARKSFFEQGYDTTSMDQIARLSGVSKATVYAHFKSKEQLLLAVVENEMCALKPQSPSTPISTVPDVEAELRFIATQFTSFFLTDRGLALHKLIVAQASHFPQIGRAFVEAGPRVLQNEVTALLREAVRLGLLQIPDIDLAAIQFLSLVRGDLPLNWALSLERIPQAQVEALIEGGIRVFMAAYGKPAEQAAARN